ncbi:MAG: protein TolR [Magnetococcales bacterium]|nr:protein TolR [Magnetococcales bacterium]
MGMGMGGGGLQQGAMSEINVTPLVDIMLVLLIIFMVAAPLMTQGVEVDLPQTEADTLTSDQEPLTVSIKHSGKTYIEEKEVSLEEIVVKAAALRKANPKLPVFVRADKKVPYGTVMEVMSHLQQGGVTQVGLVTESP